MTSSYYASQRNELHQFLPARFERLLDVGCSEGGYGAAVKQQHPGIEVWGIEPHKPAAIIAAGRLNYVINDFFQAEVDLPDEILMC